MTQDQIIDAFLIPLAWETVNGDQKAAWPYAVKRGLGTTRWLAFRYGAVFPDDDGKPKLYPTEADAIAACETEHRAEAVKTWDLAKIEALVGAATTFRRMPHSNDAGIDLNATLATIRGRT